MTTLTTTQKIAILGDKLFGNRAERLAFVSNLLGRSIESFKELKVIEKLIVYDCFKMLDKHTIDPTKNWGFFDNSKAQHRKVISTLYQLGWTNQDKKPNLERLSQWLKSSRSPVNKPINWMSKAELTKTINALEQMLTKRNKA